MYVFVGPIDKDAKIKRVTFWLDNPQRKHSAFSVEEFPQYDFAGTAPDRRGCTTCSDSPAYPFESNLLSLGEHTITARVEYKGGGKASILTAKFVIADTTPHSLLVSKQPDRRDPLALDGASLKGDVYIFLGPELDEIIGLDEVDFYLDGRFIGSQRIVPYDLVGTGWKGTADPLDTRRRLKNGYHQLKAIVRLPQGVSYVYEAEFKVKN
jgi:hypothetical protein